MRVHSRGPPRARPRNVRAKREPGAAAATRRASSKVSTSRNVGSRRDPEPARAQSVELGAAGVGRAHRHPEEVLGTWGAQADRPSSRRRRPGPAPRRRRARAGASPAASSSAASAWGVSMPTSRTGPPAATAAAASRASRPPVACPVTTNPTGGGNRSGSSTATTRVRRRARPARASSVSARAAAASSAACVGVHGGQRRVFTAPARGRLAITTTVTGSGRVTRAPPACRARCARRRGPFRSPSSVRRAAGTGTTDLLDAPAGARRAQDHLERPAEAAVLDAESEQRLAVAGPHRTEIAAGRCRVRRRTSRARYRLATRRCQGHAPGSASRAPSTRSARPARTGAATAGSDVAVERSVAVHEADDVGGGGGETREARGAEAATRFAHDSRAEPRGRARRTRRRSRCRRRARGSRAAAMRGRRAAPPARRGRGGSRRSRDARPGYGARRRSRMTDASVAANRACGQPDGDPAPYLTSDRHDAGRIRRRTTRGRRSHRDRGGAGRVGRDRGRSARRARGGDRRPRRDRHPVPSAARTAGIRGSASMPSRCSW